MITTFERPVAYYFDLCYRTKIKVDETKKKISISVKYFCFAIINFKSH